MLGFLMFGVVIVAIVYIMFAKALPAGMFHYYGAGVRKGRAEYGRIKREQPDSPDARLSEAEFVDRFVSEGPKPWKYVLLALLLMFIGFPLSCVVGFAGSGN